MFVDRGPPKPVKDTSKTPSRSEFVWIGHPGYDPPALLLQLVAYEGPSGQRGVPLSLALDACRILADNKDGSLRVEGTKVDLAGVSEDEEEFLFLSPGLYTYHAAGGEERYAICASFRAWSPPARLPARWDVMGAKAHNVSSTISDLSTFVKTSDGRCAVTGEVSRLENCHLVPRAEAKWWNLRDMALITNSSSVDSASNCLALRADLNGAGMDQGSFVFAPHQGVPACVCLTPDICDFAAEYHLRAITMPARIHPMNVYARFAWGIFRVAGPILRPLAKSSEFVMVAVPPSLRTTTSDDDDDDDDDDGTSASEPEYVRPLDLEVWTDREMQLIEEMDARLHSRPLEPYEAVSGMYPGYSKALHLKREYKRQHPEVSAVRHAKIARMGEYEDEQMLDSD
ncbi:hypothetical protein HMN09_00015400 [Mycena chlorophos]|uniref:HNH nuclease domain-containing protein n=1 Tax=Mycena chlorophos TaxID=658473 RepID=A0A8H6TV91_MYCCL|nr:hypothetical protein HMN09_00015400 [Mycena chlorophos]